MSSKHTSRQSQENLAAIVPTGWPLHLHPLTLAATGCVFCRGLGICPSGKTQAVCNCAYRQVFRICLRRYHDECDNHRKRFRLEVGVGSPNFSCPGAEYVTDFENVGMKALPVGVSRSIFEVHFLRGHDYRFAFAKAKKIDKGLSLGDYWHKLYRLQEIVGRRLITVAPCRVYPLDEYFTVRGAVVTLLQGKRPKGQRMAATDDSSEASESWPFPTTQKLREMRMQRAA